MEYKEKFFNKLSNLYSLYVEVKETILLAEEFDTEKRLYIAPLNQLRNALDHIFKAISKANQEDACESEFKEIKEHITRAGYDALVLLADNVGIFIISEINKYDTDTITHAFPEYYKVIRPTVTDIQETVALLRKEGQVGPDGTFHRYFVQIKNLIQISKEVSKAIPALEEFRQKREKEEKRKTDKTIIISAIIALISGTIFFLLGKFL